MKRIRELVVIGLALGFASVLHAQQNCNSNIPEATPTAEYFDHGDGTVTHSRTGLMWKRCSEGQNWNGNTCTGAAYEMTWANALIRARNSSTADHSDWRLPNIRELGSIVEEKCSGPAINASVFPNTPLAFFWSSSTYSFYSWLDTAWLVLFINGFSGNGKKFDNFDVRLVRGGQPYAYFDSTNTAPVASFNPDTLTFTAQTLGSTSAAQTVSFTNIGAATLNLTSISISGDFAVTNNCGAGLGVGGTCNLSVTFTPTAGGNRTGAVTVTSNAPGSPHSVSLSGVGVALAQTIGAISFSPATLTVGGTTTASATATSSLAVVFSSTTPTVCSVSGSTVTGIASGTCTVAADQAGNGTYSAATQVTQNIGVGKVSQTIGGISFSPSTLTVGGTTIASATAGSGLAVSFSSATTSFCTVSGSTVTGVAAGTCTVDAEQAGNGTYSAAPQVMQSVTVNALTAQTIIFTNPGAKTLGTAPFALSATGGASGNPVTFTSQTASICTVSGSTVTLVAVDTCTIAANQAGNASYSAAPQVTQSITVDSASQGVTFAPGWNLLGNSLNQAFSVVPAFADPALVTTVWKWDAITADWQFYAPSMDAPTLKTYATSKGYGVLAAINPGEGFWVNAKAPANLAALSGAPFSLGAAQLMPGWNLVATADNATPAAFNLSLTGPLTPQPTVGAVPINLTTLWAWDNPLSKWYFYAPSLEGQGSTALTDYVTSKGYLDFTASGKLLGAGTGFWVNRP